MEPLPIIEFRQHDGIPAFAGFEPGATGNGKAFCVLNVAAFLDALEAGLDHADLPYIIAESMMHEVIHVLEQWAVVEFSEERVDALLEKYANSRFPPSP